MPKQDLSTTAEIEIRALRDQSNAAIARHDVAAATATMQDDVRVISSHGSLVEGLPAMARAFGEVFADADFVTYLREPESIEVGGATAAETAQTATGSAPPAVSPAATTTVSGSNTSAPTLADCRTSLCETSTMTPRRVNPMVVSCKTDRRSYVGTPLSPIALFGGAALCLGLLRRGRRTRRTHTV